MHSTALHQIHLPQMYSLYAACQKKLKSYRIPKDEYAGMFEIIAVSSDHPLC